MQSKDSREQRVLEQVNLTGNISMNYLKRLRTRMSVLQGMTLKQTPHTGQNPGH